MIRVNETKAHWRLQLHKMTLFTNATATKHTKNDQYPCINIKLLINIILDPDLNYFCCRYHYIRITELKQSINNMLTVIIVNSVRDLVIRYILLSYTTRNLKDIYKQKSIYFITKSWTSASLSKVPLINIFLQFTSKVLSDSELLLEKILYIIR